MKIDKRSKQISKTMTLIKGKAVAQYDMDGNKIAEYESMREAERQTGIHAGNISRACLKDHYTTGGFKWKYIDF